MPSIIAGFLLSAGIGTAILFGTVTYAAIAGYVIYSALTYFALQALTKGGNLTSSGIQGNGVVADAPHRIIYGQQRVGGVITYEESTDDNKYLHMFLCLGGHEVEEIGTIYINDEAVTLDGSGFVTSNDWASKIRIKKHLGSDTQVADSDFLSETENAAINGNFRGRGIAYLYIRMEYDRDVFAQGMPLFTAVVKGRKVYDPRDESTAYSANAALCVLDYTTSDIGVNASSDEFDTTIWSVEADICDESVALSGGGTENRYEMNGSFTLDMPPQDVLPRMITSCAGTYFWSQGEFILKTGYYSTPVAAFDESHLRSGINVDPRVAVRDNFNTVRGTFMDADQKWITVDYPEITGAAFVTEDNGETSFIDIPFSFTTSNAMAQRLAKVTLYRNREQITFKAKFSLEAFSIQVGDNVNITNSQMGFSSKPFEVQAWQLIYDANEPIAVNMTLREISAAVFDWTAEESDIIGNETTLPPRSFFYGPRRFELTVGSLPANATAVKTEFQTEVGTPIDNDVIMFSTKSGVDTVTQDVWLYSASTDTWSQITQDVHGGTIVDKSVDTLEITGDAISDYSGVTVTTSWTDDGTWNTDQNIGEITLQVNADDDIAAEKILISCHLANIIPTMTPPTTTLLRWLHVRFDLDVYIRTGTDTFVKGGFTTWLQHDWKNANLSVVFQADSPVLFFYLEKGVDYSAGDLLVFKYGHKQTRSNTDLDFTLDVGKIYAEIKELKR